MVPGEEFVYAQRTTGPLKLRVIRPTGSAETRSVPQRVEVLDFECFERRSRSLVAVHDALQSRG